MSHYCHRALRAGKHAELACVAWPYLGSWGGGAWGARPREGKYGLPKNYVFLNSAHLQLVCLHKH